MDADCIIQGRTMGPSKLGSIQRLLAENPHCSRDRLSRRRCQLWDWRDPKGQLKDMAARSLLLKLHERRWITLPAKRWASPHRMRHKRVVQGDHATEPIQASRRQLLPLEVRELSRYPEEQPLFECLLHRYHYLSHTSSVGLNLKYLIYERGGRPVVCLVFGSAEPNPSSAQTGLGLSAAVGRSRGLAFMRRHHQLWKLARTCLGALIDLLLRLEGEVRELRRHVKELQDRLALTSRNRSQPPSTDGLAKPAPQSLRQKTGRSRGGQPGHPGRTLQPVAKPDHVAAHRLDRCPCGFCPGRSLRDQPLLGRGIKPLSAGGQRAGAARRRSPGAGLRDDSGG